MIQNADIQARQLELATKAEADKYDIEKQNADSLTSYRELMAPIIRKQRDQAANDKEQAAKDYTNYQDTIAENDNRFDNAVRDSKLADAGYQTNNPVDWIQSFSELKNRFGSAVVGKPPRAIKMLQADADKMTVPWVPGAHLVQDPSTKEFGWQGSGNGRAINVPIEQIVRQYQNPQLREGITNGLIAAGHGSLAESLGAKTKFGFGDYAKVKNVPVLDAYGNALLNKAGKVDLSRGKNEVTDVLTRPSNTRVERFGQGADSGYSGSLPDNSGVTLPDNSGSGISTEEPDVLPGNDAEDQIDAGPKQGSLQPTFTPTNTDIMLQHARNALAANPNARAQILQRLQGMGISPDYLNA
jgi:hypothetical protein